MSAGNPTGPPSSPWDDVPLWAPHYGASPLLAFVRAWRKYAVFTGRASRSEFWWWTLARIVIDAVLWGVALLYGYDGEVPGEPGARYPGAEFLEMPLPNALWALATVVPSLALIWRRLHDIGRSGLFFFMLFIPALGWIILLVLCALPSQESGARFDRPV